MSGTNIFLPQFSFYKKRQAIKILIFVKFLLE